MGASFHASETDQVAADGRADPHDGAGPERSDFRLTLWLVREREDWKIKDLHM
jgi:hypothetical protein